MFVMMRAAMIIGLTFTMANTDNTDGDDMNMPTASVMIT